MPAELAWTRELPTVKKGPHGRTHGLSSHRLYHVWQGMIKRCTDPRSTSWQHYGGRNIKVCERWLDVRNFIGDMGPSFVEGLSLNRIDNDGPYSPENCEWANWHDQANNTSRNHRVATPKGEMTLAQAARVAGVTFETLRERVYAGWGDDRILAPKQSGWQKRKRVRPGYVTPRQARAIQAELAGASITEIAEELGISENGVHHLMRKAWIRSGAKNRADLLHRFSIGEMKIDGRYQDRDAKPLKSWDEGGEWLGPLPE